MQITPTDAAIYFAAVFSLGVGAVPFLKFLRNAFVRFRDACSGPAVLRATLDDETDQASGEPKNPLPIALIKLDRLAQTHGRPVSIVIAAHYEAVGFGQIVMPDIPAFVPQPDARPHSSDQPHDASPGQKQERT